MMDGDSFSLIFAEISIQPYGTKSLTTNTNGSRLHDSEEKEVIDEIARLVSILSRVYAFGRSNANFSGETRLAKVVPRHRDY